MLRSILVGLNGSPYSDAAVELGLRWAQKCDALLVGLGVIDEPGIRRPEPTPLGAAAFKQQRDDARMEDAQRHVTQLLERFALRCAEQQVACKVLQDVGGPADQILRQAQRYDLILLGKQTFQHYPTQAGPDETLTTVLRHSPRPVVSVPLQPSGPGPVVVAYDGSLQAARALQLFQALHVPHVAEVHVLSVDADPLAAAATADRAADFLQLHGIRAQRHAVASSAPAAAILEHAQRLGAGLLVMGAYGKSTLREFFLGTVTKTILRDGNLPLFLYH